MSEHAETGIHVPWTPGRGVSRESALENEVRLLRQAVRAAGDAWVDWSEDGIRWAGFVTEACDEWVSADVADAVRRALGSGSSRGDVPESVPSRKHSRTPLGEDAS